MHWCALWLLHLKLYIIQFTSGETSLKLSQVKAILSQCEIITHMQNLPRGLWWELILRKGDHQLSTHQMWSSHCVSGTGFGARLLFNLSCVQLFVTPWAAAHQAFLSFTLSQSLFKLVSIELMMPSNHLILCCFLLLLPSPQSFPASGSGVCVCFRRE